MKLTISNLKIPYTQAYAELETDTPGTVFGITQKTDGKSKSSTSFDNTKTQGEHDDEYEANANTDEDRRNEAYEEKRSWKILGTALVGTIALFVFHRRGSNNQNILLDTYIKQEGIRTEAENRDIFKDA